MVWLCGSCEMLRKDPLVDRTKHPPGLPVNWPKRGRAKPQKDTLF